MQWERESRWKYRNFSVRKMEIISKYKKGLEIIKEIPNIMFNIFNIEVILKADAYNIYNKQIYE